MAVGFSVAVISVRHPLKASYYLVGAFFAVAAAFLLLQATLLAVLQILVYAGAVMVFIIFVIMLINLQPDELGKPKVAASKAVGVLTAVAVLGILGTAGWQALTTAASVDKGFGQVASLSEVLYIRFGFAFIALSILLMMAVVGTVVMVGKVKPKRGPSR